MSHKSCFVFFRSYEPRTLRLSNYTNAGHFFNDSSVVERRVDDRKVAYIWFDFRTGNALLCPWETQSKHIFHWGHVVYPL